jgi:hypothetical protein
MSHQTFGQKTRTMKQEGYRNVGVTLMFYFDTDFNVTNDQKNKGITAVLKKHIPNK